jgi:hypothetical protein
MVELPVRLRQSLPSKLEEFVMAVQDYFKMPQAELPAWFSNFAAKLSTHMTALGLAQADVDQATADSAIVQLSIDGVTGVKDHLKSWVDFKNLELYGPVGDPTPAVPYPTTPGGTPVAPGIITRTRDLVTRIKAAANYTDVIGEDLRVIGSEETPPAEIKPQCSAEPQPNFQTQISFVKGNFDGVTIESQRGSETVWQQIGIDMHSPYLDTRAPEVAGQPEERRYRLRYIDNDVPVGVYSDTLTATVGG